MKKIKNNWIIIDHPLIETNLSIVRDRETSNNIFRQRMKVISRLMIFEVTKKLQTIKKEIYTPLSKINGNILKNDIILIPILRAGLSIYESFLETIPEARVGHIGIYRDEFNYQANKYYFKIPKIKKDDIIYLFDPMIATGNTVIKAFKMIREQHQNKIVFISIIGSLEAKNKIDDTIDNLDIYICKIDQKLNQKKYIVPGLGDCGDRFFGTE